MAVSARSLVTQTEAEKLLEPHLSKLRKCIEVGWQAWENLQNLDPDLTRPVTARTRAGFVYDHIAFEAKRQFPADAEGGPYTTVKSGFLIIWVDDKLCLRFKKFDKRRRTRNIQTNQQRLFSMQLCLPGFEDKSTHLNAGYILDKIQQNIREVAVTCPNGKALEWWFTVEEPAAESILPHPATKHEPARRVPVRAKKSAAAKKGEKA